MSSSDEELKADDLYKIFKSNKTIIMHDPVKINSMKFFNEMDLSNMGMPTFKASSNK